MECNGKLITAVTVLSLQEHDYIYAAIFIVFPTDFMKVSAGFADECIGAVFSSVMFLSFANVSFYFELKGGPLSDSCFSELPYA